MKSIILLTAFFFARVFAADQVEGISATVPMESPMEATTSDFSLISSPMGIPMEMPPMDMPPMDMPPMEVPLPRVGKRQTAPQTCAPTMNMEQAHRNLIMAVCEQMQPGFMRNMMEPGTARNVMQSVQELGRRDEAYPAQFPPADPYYDPNVPFPHIVFPPGSSRGFSGEPRPAGYPGEPLKCPGQYEVPVPGNPQYTTCASVPFPP